VKLDDATLMRFHDGELEAKQARRVRTSALADGAVARRLDALSQLGDFVRAFAVVRAEELARERLKRQRARTAGVRARAVSLALCAAALGALWFRASPLSPGAGTRAIASDVAFGFDAPAGPAVSVESVDFGDHDGAIFLVSAAAAAAADTTVVWLGDEPPASGVGTL
jgi:hypothetical protein